MLHHVLHGVEGDLPDVAERFRLIRVVYHALAFLPTRDFGIGSLLGDGIRLAVDFFALYAVCMGGLEAVGDGAKGRARQGVGRAVELLDVAVERRVVGDSGGREKRLLHGLRETLRLRASVAPSGDTFEPLKRTSLLDGPFIGKVVAPVCTEPGQSI